MGKTTRNFPVCGRQSGPQGKLLKKESSTPFRLLHQGKGQLRVFFSDWNSFQSRAKVLVPHIAWAPEDTRALAALWKTTWASKDAAEQGIVARFPRVVPPSNQLSWEDYFRCHAALTPSRFKGADGNQQKAELSLVWKSDVAGAKL